MPRLKVVWVYAPLVARGGGFSTLSGWLRHLSADRYDLVLAYFSHEPEQVEAALAPFSHVRRIHVLALRSPTQLYIPAILALKQLFERERPDVVHSIMVQSDILGSLAARLAGVPAMVSSVIGYLVPHPRAWKGAIYRLGVRLARRRIDRVLAISGATKRELVEEFGYAPERVQVLYSGIELGAPPVPRSTPRSDGPVIGTVGQLIVEKGVQHVLRAAPAIFAAFPGARLRVVGDGVYRATLESLAVSVGIRDRVEFTGWRPDGRAEIADLDVFIFPSDPGYDGLPRVLLESWAVGTPFVSTNVAVVPEIVRDRIDGLVVPPRDPAAIARAVTRLLREPELWRHVREAGLVRVQAFSVEREVELIQQVYVDLVAKACASSSSP